MIFDGTGHCNYWDSEFDVFGNSTVTVGIPQSLPFETSVTATESVVSTEFGVVRLPSNSTLYKYTKSGDRITYEIVYTSNNWPVTRRQSFVKRTPEEEKALATFRDLVTEKEFRRYLTNGFHVVKGQGNYWYQIFNDQRPIRVFHNNVKVSTICVHTNKDCPPTDHILNMMYLIKFDESQFWKMGNVYQSHSSTSIFREPQLGQVIGFP